MKITLKRAYRDTSSGVLAAAILALIGAFISIVALWAWKGRSVVFEEIPFILTGFLGAIGSVILLFLFNLACAPYRIERDAHAETRKQLDELSEGQPAPLSASVQLGNDAISVAKKIRSQMDDDKPEPTLPNDSLPFFGELTSVTIRLNAMGMPTPTDKDFYDRYGIGGNNIYFPKMYALLDAVGQLLVASEIDLAIEHANKFTAAFEENPDQTFYYQQGIIKELRP